MFVAACLAVASSTVAAHAEDAPKGDDFTTRMFATTSFDHKTYACFVRRYDADHMAHHPQQKVTAMKLLVTAEKLDDDPTLRLGFRVGVTFRDRRGGFSTSGDCGHADASEVKDDAIQMQCAVDCDGGGVGVGLAPGDQLVTLKLDQVRIWRDNGSDDDPPQFLRGGADDKVFRLDRTANAACASLVPDKAELAALRRQ